jgi:hypothetical protein
MFHSAGESKSGTTAGATAVEIGYDMVPGRQYRLTARGANLWFRVVVAGATGSAVAAVAGDGSHYLANGSTFDVAAIGKQTDASGAANASYRGRVSIIRDGATDATGVISEIPTVQP